MRSVGNEGPHGRQNGHLQAKGRKRTYTEENDEHLSTKKYRLTEKNLRRYQKQEKTMVKPRKISANSDKSSYATTNTTTTDRQFGPRLTENGVVFEQARTIAPLDLAEVRVALAQELQLPAEADTDFQNILEAKEEMAHGELSLESTIIETMLLKCPRFKYHRFRNDQWTEIENEITAGISDPKPDVVETYIWSAYPGHTREDFEDLVPTQYGYSMPTFAMESKGEGDAGQAVKQAAYDGAIMTHASITAEKQMGKEDLYSKTKAITITLTPNEVCVYTNHAVRDQLNGKVAYHQHRVEKISYMDSEHDWKRACSVVRNAQAFAQSLADSRIRDIKEYFDAKEVQLRKLKAERDRLAAEAKAEQEILQAKGKAEQEKRQAEAKAERQKRQAEAKLERQKRQAEAKAHACKPSTPRKNLSGAKIKKAAANVPLPVITQANQDNQATTRIPDVDTQISHQQAKMHV